MNSKAEYYLYHGEIIKIQDDKFYMWYNFIAVHTRAWARRVGVEPEKIKRLRIHPDVQKLIEEEATQRIYLAEL